MATTRLWRYNDYRIDGNAAYLILRDKHRRPCGETIIDLWDLERVREMSCWRKVTPKPGLAYVYGTLRGPAAPVGKEVTLYLHRVIVNCPPELECDHWNGDGLDNRRENLRIVPRGQNSRNREGHRRVRALEAAIRDLLRCPHEGQQCACKQRALALIASEGID